MLKIKLVCVGKIKDNYLNQGISEYLKRLSGYCGVEIIEVKDEKIVANNSDDKIKEIEGSRILENVNCAIILLMEDDSKLVSKEFKIVDMAASIQNIMLEATKHKIGTCWIGVCPNKERMEGVKNIINSQKDVFAMLAIGYPLDENAFHSLNRYDEERINFIK